MEKISTERLVIGCNKLKVGKLVRIETHNSFNNGSLLRTVIGTVESIKKQDYKLTIILTNALDDGTWDSREKVNQKVKFEWTVGCNHAYYYLDKDSDLVNYDYKYIISNATDASLRALAKRIKQIHLKHIEEWRNEIEKIQKEINGYNIHIKTATKFVKNFERTYKI